VLRIMADDRGAAFDPALFDVVEALALDGTFAEIADRGRGFDLPWPVGEGMRRSAAA
jgi:hypothetical protein